MGNKYIVNEQKNLKFDFSTYLYVPRETHA